MFLFVMVLLSECLLQVLSYSLLFDSIRSGFFSSGLFNWGTARKKCILECNHSKYLIFVCEAAFAQCMISSLDVFLADKVTVTRTM